MNRPGQNNSGFPVILSFGLGLQTLWTNRAVLSRLMIFPFIVTFLTMAALRFAGDNVTPLWAAIAQLPSSFLIGAALSITLRWIMLHENPLLREVRREQILPVRHGAVTYTLVNHMMAGVYAVMLYLQSAMAALGPENPKVAPYFFAGLVLLVAVVWSMRYMWLIIPVAMNWPLGPFYERLGRWSGSLRVFALFAACSILLNLVIRILNNIVYMTTSGSSAVSGVLRDIIGSGAAVLMSVMFLCCSIHAVRFMMSQEKKT